METLKEKIAHLKGLCEGMDIDTTKGEGKLLAKIIELLDDVADDFECLYDDVDEMQAQVDEIDEDLSFVEELVYDEDEDDDYCDCCDSFDCADIECPNCGETIMLDADIFDEEDDVIVCPACGHEIEIECDCDCDCGCDCDDDEE